MAEFGVRATELANPQGAGSAPIAPVQQPSVGAVDLSGLGNLFTGLVNKKTDEKPWMNMRNDYAKKATAIQEAVLTGQVDERRGYNQLKMLTTQYQRQGADFGSDYTKSIADTFTQLRLGTGIEELQDINKTDTKATVDSAEALRKAGVYIPPLAEQTQADKDFIVRQNAQLNNLNRIAEESQTAIDNRNKQNAADRSAQEFQWKQQDMQRQRDAQYALSNMKSDALGFIPNLISSLQKRGGTPQEKQQLFEQSIAGMTSLASNVLIADPGSLRNYQESLQGMIQLGRDMFDPSKDLKQLEDELKRRITTEQLMMTDDPTVLKASAVDKLLANSPAATMATAQAASRVLMDDLKKGTTANVVPSIVTNDQNTQRQTFRTIGTTISNAVSGRSGDPQADLNAAGKMASSTMKTVGMLNANSQVSLELTKDFIASSEFGELIKQGKFDPDAADQARPVFQSLYMEAFAERFKKDIVQPIGDVNYVNGKPDPAGATLGRIMDFKVNPDGSVKAVKLIDPELRITASPIYIDRQIREAQKMAQGLSQVLKASAHLDGRTDYSTYWEEYKPYLVPGLYPPPEFIERLKSEKGYIGTGSVLNPANYRKQNGTTGER